MNDTRQQWAYRGACPQALIENQQQSTINARGAALCSSRSVEQSPGRINSSSAREEQFCFLGNSTATHKKEIVFHRRQFFLYQLHSIISEKRLLRNTFAIEGVFLAMLDDVSMSLASANRHKRKYV
jgi:hypothetical protein